jgi:hypothetical protein
MAAAALAAGLIITVLFLGNMDPQPVPGCGGRGFLSPHAAPLARCETLAEGYPIHYLSAVPSLGLISDNKVTAGNIALFADPAISKGAAAEDAAIWTVLSFTACYLIWLPSQRRTQPGAAPQPVTA